MMKPTKKQRQGRREQQNSFIELRNGAPIERIAV